MIERIMGVDFEVNECACSACRKMCDTPCWALPSEIEAIVAAGYRSLLEADIVGIDTNIVRPADNYASGYCIFYSTSTGKCFLHDRGLKPFNARVTCACKLLGPEGRADAESVTRKAWGSVDGKHLFSQLAPTLIKRKVKKVA